jgi:hypothetical protein
LETVHRIALPFFALPFALLLTACHGSTTSGSPQNDATTGDDGNEYSGCTHPDPPKVGTDCSTPTNQYCQYGNECMPPTFVCDDNGRWEDITDALPPVPCPDSFPDAGTQCPRCAPLGFTCGYDAGCMSGTGVLSARCDAGVWEPFCAVPDAGTDDGGADASDAGANDAGPTDAPTD